MAHQLGNVLQRGITVAAGEQMPPAAQQVMMVGGSLNADLNIEGE